MNRSRRLAAATAVLALALPAATATGSASAESPQGSEDAIAAVYYKALELNTPQAESTWDAAAGHYRAADFDFVNVLGNAVLLNYGSYDPSVTGVAAATLKDHTVRSIEHFAASNRWIDPNGDWGKVLYFDSTMESYFAAAAKLMWSDLSDQARSDVDTMIRDEADYVVQLGPNQDPASGSWTTNGLAGGYQGDTKMEEMGVRTMPLATALAWFPDDPAAPAWREWLDRWTLNMGGLPAADAANPTVVDGTPVSGWASAHNVYDTFLVENHGGYAPIYQQSIGAYPGRSVVQSLLADRAAPPVLKMVTSADQLWFTMGQTGMDAGVPEDLTVPDRHHLYGRNILPITYRALVVGDPYAARAEQMLADHLIPYVQYPPAGRLTKFSGQPSYEPEARAETAMAYLLHYWRDRLAGDVTPVSTQQYFAHFSTATDYGAGPGIVAQQSPNALAAAVTKPGYTKFDFLPQHDDWLFDVSGGSPSFLPTTGTPIAARTTHVYRHARDGIDATATTIRTPSGGVAGFTTLPDGSVVYASSGIGSNEGVMRLYNLDMPGVPGLTGSRTFTGQDGAFTLGSDDGNGNGGTDDVTFAATQARYVRMQGVQAVNRYGYSLYEFEVYGPTSAANLALGRTATASSYDNGSLQYGGPFPPQLAVDGNPSTRWAVATSQRSNQASWFQVDLGAVQSVDHVRLLWENAYATQYRIQVSDDGQNWRDAATVPDTRTVAGNWLNVDGRAGFVVHDSRNPITATATGFTLSAGPAAGSAGMTIEGYPAQSPAQTQAAADAPTPATDRPVLRASVAGGQLSLFNLGTTPISDGAVTVPQPQTSTTLFLGTQRTTPGGTQLPVALPAADATVTPAMFSLTDRLGGSVPSGLVADVLDSHTVQVTAPPHGAPLLLSLRSLPTGETQELTVPAGESRTATFSQGLLLPTPDLARTATTYPTSPLPAGMTSPSAAVDGDPATTWQPGPDGRMVVDLGAVTNVGEVQLQWGAGLVPGVTVQTSADGLTYSDVGTVAGSGAPTQTVSVNSTARYVAVAVNGWHDGEAGLADLAVLPPNG